MIELVDISHWNKVNSWQKMKDAGIKGVYIKFSQGTGYKDPKALDHYVAAKSVKMKVGAYHFVTTGNALEQHDWFMKCIKDLIFDLTPMLDCEAYTSQSETGWKVNALGTRLEEVEVFPVKELRYKDLLYYDILSLSVALGYSYPTEAIVDSMGRKLMGFQGFQYPSIYTNYSAGNMIFKSVSMKKYPLHIANWGVSKPLLPNVWVGEEYYIWQDNVVDGNKYGVEGKVDHNIWGDKIEFPEDTTPPPPPVDEIFVTAYPKGIKYQGTLKRSQ